METLFGLQMSTLAFVMLGALALVLIIMGIIAASNRFLIRLSLRNLPRRPAQTVLIVVGLMLATTIISASFAVGDTITVSIRQGVIEGIGDTDIIVRKPTQGNFERPILTDDEVNTIIAALEGENAVDGVMPATVSVLPVLNQRTRLTEARTVVRGYDIEGLYGSIDVPPGPSLAPFFVPDPIEGPTNDMRNLADGEVFVNRFLQREINAQVGDTLTIYSPIGQQEVTVAAILDRGGIGSADNRIMMPIDLFNSIVGAPQGSASRVDISLNTDNVALEDASENLRTKLANEFVNQQALSQLISALASSNAFMQRLDEYIVTESVQGGALNASQADDLREIHDSLRQGNPSDRFVELITSIETLGLILGAFADADDPALMQLVPQLTFGAQQITELQITEIKVDGLSVADAVGNLFVTFFTFFGSFTVIVGLLLVFLIFVLLASERMHEMGISRAVGLKRGHLVQMFTIEGLAYAIGAAAVGTVVGILASRFLVILMAQAFGGAGGENFVWRFTITQWSISIAFALGLVLTFLTVIYSASRVSLLNIVVAIRDLPEEFATSQNAPLLQRIISFALWTVGPFYSVFLLIRRIRRKDNIVAGVLTVIATWLIIGWIVAIIVSFVRIWTPLLSQGWPIAIIGALMTAIPFTASDGALARAAWFAYLGASVAVYGSGTFIRWALIHFRYPESNANRISYTLTGLILLIMWALPTRFVEPITGELDGNVSMFILAGVWMVASAVWVVMYNSDILVNAISATLGRFAGMRAVLKPAVAYAVNNRFRTGLTVSMFALVIFVMMVFSILNSSFSSLTANPELVSGGYDIRAEVEPDLPIDNLQQRIADSADLNPADFEAIAGQSEETTRARQIGAEDIQLRSMNVRGSEPAYFRSNQILIQAADPQYLPPGIDINDEPAVSRAVWDALAEDPSLAVITDEHIPGAGGQFVPQDQGQFIAEGFTIGSGHQFTAFDVEFIGPAAEAAGSTETTTRTVIGVTDANADSLEGDTDQGPVAGFVGLHTRNDVFQSLLGEIPPFTIYRITLRDSADPSDIAGRMETAFVENSMVAVDTKAEIDAAQASNQQFNLLFQGFMGLGLVVGAASVGVLAMRAVNERRKHIAIMRALGYRETMIRTGFIIESVFVAAVGTLLGVILGAIVSWSFLDDTADQAAGLTFAIPWLNVSVVVGITIIAALITTYVPARQASKIYPAEALRFE